MIVGEVRYLTAWSLVSPGAGAAPAALYFSLWKGLQVLRAWQVARGMPRWNNVASSCIRAVLNTITLQHEPLVVLLPVEPVNTPPNLGCALFCLTCEREQGAGVACAAAPRSVAQCYTLGKRRGAHDLTGTQ